LPHPDRYSPPNAAGNLHIDRLAAGISGEVVPQMSHISSAILPGRDHIESLDGVRGLAILMVVVHNASWIQSHEAPSFIIKLTIAVTSTWWVGVSLFFVLSGVLITGILVTDRGSPGYFQSFFVRRALRIFPLYYAFLAIAFFVGPRVIDNPEWQASVRDNQLWYWTYLQNWPRDNGAIAGLPHLWSLAVEEQFYLVWPVVVLLIPPRILAAVCFAIVAITPVIRFMALSLSLPHAKTFVYAVARWDALAIGALIAILLHGERGRAWLQQYAFPVAGLSLTALLFFVAIHRGFHAGDPEVDVYGQLLIAVLFAAVIGGTVVSAGTIGTALQRALSRPWLRFLGKYSYAIYLFHAPMHHLSAPQLSHWVNSGEPLQVLLKLVAYDAFVLASSIGLALLSWNILEKPFLQLRNRIAPRRTIGNFSTRPVTEA
jgi:peptidoglycan/LPS O-acetylase OafA/YrhL